MGPIPCIREEVIGPHFSQRDRNSQWLVEGGGAGVEDEGVVVGGEISSAVIVGGGVVCLDHCLISVGIENCQNKQVGKYVSWAHIQMIVTAM